MHKHMVLLDCWSWSRLGWMMQYIWERRCTDALYILSNLVHQNILASMLISPEISKIVRCRFPHFLHGWCVALVYLDYGFLKRWWRFKKKYKKQKLCYAPTKLCLMIQCNARSCCGYFKFAYRISCSKIPSEKNGKTEEEIAYIFNQSILLQQYKWDWNVPDKTRRFKRLTMVTMKIHIVFWFMHYRNILTEQTV